MTKEENEMRQDGPCQPSFQSFIRNSARGSIATVFPFSSRLSPANFSSEYITMIMSV